MGLLIRNYPRAGATGLGLLICVVVIAVAELVLRVLLPSDSPLVVTDMREYAIRDRFGVAKGQPGRHPAAATYRESGDSLYDVTYSIDQFGLRKTPVKNRANRDLFLLLMGGSTVFGAGVEDDDTLGFRLGQLTERFMPYNLGFFGADTFETLARIQTTNFAAQVSESHGIALYLLLTITSDAVRDHCAQLPGT